jgi:hypothetical protein
MICYYALHHANVTLTTTSYLSPQQMIHFRQKTENACVQINNVVWHCVSSVVSQLDNIISMYVTYAIILHMFPALLLPFFLSRNLP